MVSIEIEGEARADLAFSRDRTILKVKAGLLPPRSGFQPGRRPERVENTAEPASLNDGEHDAERSEAGDGAGYYHNEKQAVRRG